MRSVIGERRGNPGDEAARAALTELAEGAPTRTAIDFVPPLNAGGVEISMLVVGAGSAGSRHLRNARSLGVAQLSVFRTGLGVMPDSLPEGIRLERDLDRALSRGVDAVVIANPTALHLPAAMKAVDAGCDVLVEKPLAHRLEAIGGLRSAIRARGRIAMVGYQFRFHPALSRVREWLQAEAIGRVTSCRAHWGEYLPDWQPWRDYRTSYSARNELGGGALLTLSHPVDYLRWLLGDVVSVFAEISSRSFLSIDVEDTVVMNLVFASGALGTLTLDYVQSPPSHGFTLVGTRGVIQWDGITGGARLQGRSASESFAPGPGFERNSMFLAELDHFLGCVLGRNEPVCGIEDGEAVLRICHAAKESAELARRVDV